MERLTFWQYTAALHEHARREKNPSGAEPMTDEEYDEMLDAFRAWHLPDVKV